jgi:hypothetical protein
MATCPGCCYVVPRARVGTAGGGTAEWKSRTLPRVGSTAEKKRGRSPAFPAPTPSASGDELEVSHRQRDRAGTVEDDAALAAAS